MYFDNFETFIKNATNTGKIFRVRALRKMWTPKEQENKYIDQDEYEPLYDYCKITEVIKLGENPSEYLLGFKEIYINEEIIDHEYKTTIMESDTINYYNLKDILLIEVTILWKNELKESNILEETQGV